MSFEKQVQDWVSIDNQLKILTDKVRDLREKKNAISGSLTKYAETNNLANSAIQISDGKLKFANTKVTEPLTFKYLDKTLSEVIKNESQVRQIMEHIKAKRQVKIIKEIKRFTNN
uniref:Uncharacterized protein n=1 Tax=viral metagenome TaxID=1070528 RepID=A0A6C0KVJ6_9ZZZZ